MQTKETITLSGVPETMLQTVYARAKESSGRGAIRDRKAEETIGGLQYDFSLADRDKAMHSGVIARTIVLDRLTGAWLQEHPGGTVVNIACGLDTRCYRMEGYGRWYNLDLPETIAVRQRLLPEKNADFKGKHILLVEDNDINMEVAEFQLTSQGAAVDKAWNGREAVERFAASAPGGYQAILMDVMMPVMDGFEASRAIRALDRPDAATVPILAMTAQASDECAQSCHQVGMNGRLVKPLDAKKLAKSIREAVQNKQ